MNKTNDFKFNLPAYSDPVDVEDLNDNFRGIDDALMAGLCKKDYTGNNMGSSDPSARKYAWAPWLEIVNDNEFDVVVTDRNAPVESEEATINIAAGQTFRKYVNGRYYMNFYVQDQHDVTFKWFTNAETYINESGGGGGGTGTVTSVSVQGGSGSHLTGSGNPIETSGTITINVDEGYSIPSDNEQDAWDGKAADLKAEIDSSTYVLTLQLKDSAGNLIGTAKTIDLPLETMVVDGEYDSQTQKIKLELKNGNYVEFSVADLVSGLQTELSASNKLNPEYIAYDASHRAVSDTEKSTWNSKQNAISDLATIRSGAAAGATAVQPSEMEDALDEKQDSLNSTQLAAVNSGITSEKVTQIETNKTNILYALNTGVKNALKPKYSEGSFPAGGITYNADGTVTIKTDSNHSQFSARIGVFKPEAAGDYYITGIPQGASSDTYFINIANTQYSVNRNIYGDDEIQTEGGGIEYDVWIYVRANVSCNVTFSTMIRPSYTDTTYVRPTLPNSDLTYLEAEDRAALAEVVDSGAKNLLDMSSISDSQIYRSDAITLTRNAANEFTITRASSSAIAEVKIPLPTSLPINTPLILSGCPSGGTYATYSVEIWENNVGVSEYDYGSGSDPYTFTTTTGRYLRIRYGANTSYSNQKFKFMFSTKAAFGVSSAFVPYRPDYDTLLGMLVTKYPTYVSNTTNTYKIQNSHNHLLMVRSYNEWETACVLKYDNDSKVYCSVLNKSADFDTYVTITASTDNSGELTITSKSTVYWFVANLIGL